MSSVRAPVLIFEVGASLKCLVMHDFVKPERNDSTSVQKKQGGVWEQDRATAKSGMGRVVLP